MRRIRLLLTTLLLTSLTTLQAQKYVGGDISVLPKYEAQKATFFDQDGKSITDVLTFVKEQGWNTIRVRLFVDPSKDTEPIKTSARILNSSSNLASASRMPDFT